MTVSGNQAQAQGYGGGLYNLSGSIAITSITIANNSGAFGGGIFGNASLLATIVAYNPGLQDGQDSAGGAILTRGWNIESGHSCNLVGLGDQMDLDPLLSALTERCGTRVHTLLEGSPAIDAIPFASCPVAEDQCGNLRPSEPGGYCDIGAYETPWMPQSENGMNRIGPPRR